MLLYHFGVQWMPGGFLGVEVFFVISGYLITSLLLAEWRADHGISLGRFWGRRARRLLPALFAMLAVVSAAALLFAPDAVPELRRGVLAAVVYVTNWYEIIGKQSYFARFGRPPLLLHLWSLAVEEQFYLIWPPLLLVGLRLTHGRRRPLVYATLAGAAASALTGLVLYHPGVDPSRVYYGTDTRASGLLLGCVLAMLWAPSRLVTTIRADARFLLEAIGVLSMAGLLWLMWKANEFDPFVYRGGFVVVDLLTLGVIAVAVHPAPTFGRRLLGSGPMRWIGQRSYAIYLWHWPVYALTRPGVDVPLSGNVLLAVRLAVTLGLADLSYRYIEMPARNGALGRWWRSLPRGAGRAGPAASTVGGRLVGRSRRPEPGGRRLGRRHPGQPGRPGQQPDRLEQPRDGPAEHDGDHPVHDRDHRHDHRPRRQRGVRSPPHDDRAGHDGAGAARTASGRHRHR